MRPSQFTSLPAGQPVWAARPTVSSRSLCVQVVGFSPLFTAPAIGTSDGRETPLRSDSRAREMDDAALEKVEFDLPIDPGDYRPMVTESRRDAG